MLRGTVFAAGAAVGGYALTMLFRSTVATLGVLFAVSLLVPLMLALIAFPGYERWMPQNNIAAFSSTARRTTRSSCTDADDLQGASTSSRWPHGAAYLLVLLAARRRAVGRVVPPPRRALGPACAR